MIGSFPLVAPTYPRRARFLPNLRYLQQNHKPHPTVNAPHWPMPTGFSGYRHLRPSTTRWEGELIPVVENFKEVVNRAYEDTGRWNGRLNFLQWVALETHATSGHPQSSWQVESTLIVLLETFTKNAKLEDWNLSLRRVVLAYKPTLHLWTGDFDVQCTLEPQNRSGFQIHHAEHGSSSQHCFRVLTASDSGIRKLLTRRHSCPTSDRSRITRDTVGLLYTEADCSTYIAP